VSATDDPTAVGALGGVLGCMGLFLVIIKVSTSCRSMNDKVEKAGGDYIYGKNVLPL
jgi:hypothetical protein